MSHTKKLIYSGLCLALAMVLPFLTGQVPEIGNMLCPMHIPVLLCGFLCGPLWGGGVGFAAPLVRFALFGMPAPSPMGIPMAFELCTYGLVCGWLYRRTGKLYLSLIAAMVAGRLVWGCAKVVQAGLLGTAFPFSAFLAGAVTSAIPGILLQLVILPPIVGAVTRQPNHRNDS